MQRLYSFIYYRILKWEIIGEIPASLTKCVLVVAPHTSWHDFFLGVLVRGVLQQKMHFVGKKELFTFPFGFYFKWMGGAPLDRTSGQNKVERIAAIFKKRSVFRLAIAPEGTRKKVSSWKSGFYYIALQAEVPMVLVAFDFSKKQVRFSTPYYPSGDYNKDLPQIKAFYKGVVGKVATYTSVS